MTKFRNFYSNRGEPVTFKPNTETKFVDQSEADRASLKFQLERYGMDSLLQQLEKTKAQFGYADTRLTKSFAELSAKMTEANDYFMKLPSRIRAQYNHNAIEFYSELEKNPTKMYESGFISKEMASQLGVDMKKYEPVTEFKEMTPTTPTTPVEQIETAEK